MQISLKTPGIPSPLPDYIMDQLKNLHPRYKRQINFFGGHPVSITKQTVNQIFTQIQQTSQGLLQSPYLVCQKTDGVRFILLICHVFDEDFEDQKELESRQGHQSKKDKVQCYLVSRQGQRGLVAYKANMNVGEGWSKKSQTNFQHIISILDGQLIMDKNKGKSKEQTCKYLIFDILIHLGQNITKLSLINRLRQINKFQQCNSFLLQNVPRQIQRERISLQLKDFFRLSSMKYNIIQFLQNKYIACLPHQNDGLIFNHGSKQYQFGVNHGYIKWKPAHLNTLDFMLVPNTNLSDKFGNRVLDMYLAVQDKEIQTKYVRTFYSFTVVGEDQFQEIQQIVNKNKDKQFLLREERDEDGQGEHLDKEHFQGALIAECRFVETTQDQRAIFKELFDVKKQPADIQQFIAKSYDQKSQLARISSLQKMVYDKCWKIYKIRDDKGFPNNVSVAQRIQQSIKDNIKQEQLIKKSDQLNKKCRPTF